MSKRHGKVRYDKRRYCCVCGVENCGDKIHSLLDGKLYCEECFTSIMYSTGLINALDVDAVRMHRKKRLVR